MNGALIQHIQIVIPWISLCLIVGFFLGWWIHWRTNREK